jgi:alkaline phosphatase D
MDRRTFLLAGTSALGVSLARLSSAAPFRLQPTFSTSPFTLGVASGDPQPDGVVLWTRLAPDPLAGGGMPPEAFEVGWRIATDEGMRDVVQRGSALATPELGHSVHVEVDGLSPARWYWYQLDVAGHESPVGRTRTAPALTASVDRLRFAFVSCQHYEQGHFTALEHLAREDLELVAHLGDYIYEGPGSADRVRRHLGEEIQSLEDYRNRYAQYKSDPALQAAHAACPWLVTWDDHEVDNNYAARTSERADPVGAFLERRAAAYQAYYEHMPLRASSMPVGPDLLLYRHVGFGRLAGFFVLDTRQYRTDQPCGDGLKAACDGVRDPHATLLGAHQARWLFDGLDRSASRWNVLAQQVMMARVDRRPGDERFYSMDQWGGYDAARTQMMSFLDRRKPSNPVVLTGDIHTNWVNDLKADFDDPSSATVATEFVGTSLTSGGDGADTRPATDGVLAENPFVRFFNGQRGYVRCEVTPERWTSDYRVVDYVSRPGSPIATRASFLVEAGRPGAQRL